MPESFRTGVSATRAQSVRRPAAPAKKFELVDAAGTPIRKGDIVRILGVPSNPIGTGARDSKSLFEHLVGKYRRVDGFEPFGRAEMNILIREGPLRGRHRVWIEPVLLRVRRIRDPDFRFMAERAKASPRRR